MGALALKHLAMVLATFAALTACEPQETTRASGTAPELSVLDREERSVKLADFRGKVVLVNFWLAECGPCLVEMPEFDEAYRKYRKDGFEVLAVNMGQDADAVRKTRRRLEVSYPLVSDPLKITTQRYGVRAAPTSFLIDRDGNLHERINAPLSREDLEKKLDKLL